MAVDRAAVGEVAARLMDQLEERYGDRSDANVGAVVLIVTVNHAEEDGMHTEVRSCFSKGLSKHEGIGLLEYVKNRLLFR